MNIPHFTEFKNKVIVITGGAGVLCRVLAKALAHQEAKIAILDLNIDLANDLADEINKEGGTAIGVEANVLDIDSLQKAHKEVLEKMGTCDILINGAGGNHPKGTTTKTHFFKEDLKNNSLITFFDLDPKSIQFVFDLNFMGTLLPTQVFSKDMLSHSKGVILNISSMNAYRPLTKIPAYSAAKAAVTNFTQWLAVHFAPVGIRVNALAPGFFITEQNKSLLVLENGEYTERGKKVLEHTPLGRFGIPEDLVAVTLWLLGEQSTFVTGTTIPIDGGFSAFSGV